MKKVFKLCLGTAPDGMFLSIFRHASNCVYYIGKKTTPTVGLLYAFSTGKAALDWISVTIKKEQKGDLMERLLSQTFNVYLLSGECTRIVSRYAPTIHHLPLVQLRQRSLLEEFWGNNVTDRSTVITDSPEPPGSILIPDFRPTEVVETINLRPVTFSSPSA